VSAALVNYEVRKKDKQSSFKSTTAKAITVRGMSFNHRTDKGEFGKPGKSKTGGRKDLKKNQCDFCREGH